MRVDIKQIEVNEDKTINELVDELQLSTSAILVEVNGQVFYSDEIKDGGLRKGDKVVLVPLIAGG